MSHNKFGQTGPSVHVPYLRQNSPKIKNPGGVNRNPKRMGVEPKLPPHIIPNEKGKKTEVYCNIFIQKNVSLYLRIPFNEIWKHFSQLAMHTVFVLTLYFTARFGDSPLAVAARCSQTPSLPGCGLPCTRQDLGTSH